MRRLTSTGALYCRTGPKAGSREPSVLVPVNRRELGREVIPRGLPRWSFIIQNLAGNLFVTYALQDATKSGDLAGAGHGFVDEFDTSGNYLRRIASGGGLDSPGD